MVFFHQVREVPDGLRLVLSGEIDIAVCEELRTVLAGVIAASPGVIDVDLHGVTFLDCSGVGVFVRAYNDAQRRGHRLTISRPQGIVGRVLELTDDLSLLPHALVAFVPAAMGDLGLTADRPVTFSNGRAVASSTVQL